MEGNINSRMIGPAEASIVRTSEQIQSDVESLIAENDAVRPKNVKVEVAGGVVTLSGRLESDFAVEQSVRAAKDALGVVEVKNHLEVA
jgi:osmotically-inducible protein OsmY